MYRYKICKLKYVCNDWIISDYDIKDDMYYLVMAEPEEFMNYAYYQNSNLKHAVDNFNNTDIEDSIEILEWEKVL